MTRRRSRRELEHAVDDMTARRAPDDEPDPPIVHQDPETGEWRDPDGNPVDEDADPLMVIEIPPEEEA